MDTKFNHVYLCRRCNQRFSYGQTTSRKADKTAADVVHDRICSGYTGTSTMAHSCADGEGGVADWIGCEEYI